MGVQLPTPASGERDILANEHLQDFVERVAMYGWSVSCVRLRKYSVYSLWQLATAHATDDETLRDMYVFVLDSSGNPVKGGTRVHGILGVDGASLLAAVIEQADVQPGWVEYDIVNPPTGDVQTKMSHVQKFEGIYQGCGIYK